MKLFLLAFFVAVAVASPIPDDGENIDVIVNGVPEGAALDIAHVIDIQAHEKVNGDIVATSNVLHPYTAQGIAEAVAAAAAENDVVEVPVDPVIVAELPEVETPAIPVPVILPQPILPEVFEPAPVILPEAVLPAYDDAIPEPVVLPSPVAPEVVEPAVPAPVVLPSPVAPEVVEPVVPAPVVLPEPVAPVVIPGPEATPVLVVDNEAQVPAPVQAGDGELYNDGVVSVAVNSEPGILDHISNLFNMVLNYVTASGSTQSTQIV